MGIAFPTLSDAIRIPFAYAEFDPMQEKWGQLTGWLGTLSDSVRGFFGLDGVGGAAPLGAAPSAAPVNLGPTTASIQQSRTEHVERQTIDIRVSSKDGTPLDAAMAIEGDTTQTGKISSTGDQVAGGVSQMGHTHTGVQPGSSTTGIPVGGACTPKRLDSTLSAWEVCILI